MILSWLPVGNYRHRWITSWLKIADRARVVTGGFNAVSLVKKLGKLQGITIKNVDVRDVANRVVLCLLHPKPLVLRQGQI
ncbi:hypothetical protein TIFTF001_026082 [Ficus carica]|uniref:Uncharacterized protein n=1 Tax=Ficus carica TaxID=3494 RepID=A0AA88AK79_FICCA|nr:hypothetical protein TIFTF001_026082 [Ficus carica]